MTILASVIEAIQRDQQVDDVFVKLSTERASTCPATFPSSAVVSVQSNPLLHIPRRVGLSYVRRHHLKIVDPLALCPAVAQKCPWVVVEVADLVMLPSRVLDRLEVVHRLSRGG